MNKLTKVLSIAIVAATPFAGSIQTASATDDIVTQTTRINYHGFQKCKALGNDGFKASASGFSFDGPGGGNFSGGGFAFRINTCFETKATCQNFIDNIHKHVSSIHRLYHARCIVNS